MSKADKQREFLAPRVSQAKYAALHGIHSLRFVCCVTEANECETSLNSALEILENVPVTKENLKSALETIDTTIDAMTHVYTERVFGKDSSALEVDDTYFEPPSTATVDYQKRMQKAFEAKQKHAPGFDGQGGGRGRS